MDIKLDNPDDFFVKGKLYTFVNKYMHESDTGSFCKHVSNTDSSKNYKVYKIKNCQFIYLYCKKYRCYFLNEKHIVYFVHCPAPHRLLKDFWVAI